MVSRGPRARARRLRTTAGLSAVVSVLAISVAILGSPLFGVANELELEGEQQPEPLPEFSFDGHIDPGPPPVVDFVRVFKRQRRLELLSEGELVAQYAIALGDQPEGHKQQQGDERTPEGFYVIDWRKEDSAFHRALHISYPNSEDVRRARELGVDPGGAIMIHGLPNNLAVIGSVHTVVDWTDGCIAVTNAEIEEIWRLVQDGVAIEILP